MPDDNSEDEQSVAKRPIPEVPRTPLGYYGHGYIGNVLPHPPLDKWLNHDQRVEMAKLRGTNPHESPLVAGQALAEFATQYEQERRIEEQNQPRSPQEFGNLDPCTEATCLSVHTRPVRLEDMYTTALQGDPPKYNRPEVRGQRMAYKDGLKSFWREKGLRVTDLMIALSANRGWSDRTPVMRWQEDSAEGSRYDRMICGAIWKAWSSDQRERLEKISAREKEIKKGKCESIAH
jgi:hypothetical protein